MPDQLAAPALSLGLFCYWGVLGYAALALLRSQRNVGQNLLLAPAVGVAVHIVPIFWLSWLNLPVLRFGPAVLVTLPLLAAVVLVNRRPILPGRLVWRFALPLLAAFVLIGWPLARNGFAWLGHANDDMANYCLLAQRLLYYGLHEPPPLTEITSGRDLSLFYYFLEIGTARPGSQLLLASVTTIAGKPVPELFMPVMLALHLALVATTGALVYRRPYYRSRALTACWLMAVSALATLGIISQLIAQAVGLTLGAALAAVAWEHPRNLRPVRLVSSAMLLGLVGAALLLAYPEVAPFIALALVWRMAFVAVRRLGAAVQLVTFAGAGIIGGLLLAPYLKPIVRFLLEQTRHGGGGASDSSDFLFPYYLVPTGLANFWGLLSLAEYPDDPWTSLAIAGGALLMFLSIVWVTRLIKKGDAAPSVLLWMLPIGIILFGRGGGFGLFKLAMFAQPFLIGTLALLPSVTPHGRVGWPRAALLLVVCVANLRSQSVYVQRSIHGTIEIGDYPALFRDFHEAHRLRTNSLDVDLPDVVTAKLLAVYTRGVPARIINRDMRLPIPLERNLPPGADRSRAQSVDAAAQGMAERHRFHLLDSANPGLATEIVVVDPRSRSKREPSPARCETLIAEGALQTVFNRLRTPARRSDPLTLGSCGAIANHLAFVSSDLGRHYYHARREAVGIFGLEPHYFYSDDLMAGAGRYLVFEVINPTPEVRFFLDASASLKADRQNKLPPAEAIGSSRVPLPLVGRGSARVYSPPFRPQVLGGRSYVALDLGVNGTRYPDRRPALSKLYGSHVSLDPREIVLLARNISLVSETGDARLNPPRQLDQFPQDLSDTGLEYSGLYEDGWVGEEATLRLTRPAGSASFVVRGIVPPQLNEQQTIAIMIEGEPIARQALRAGGPFEVLGRVAAGDSGTVEIRLRFSKLWQPSSGDTRPVAALLQLVGFETR